jgi:hypothetical protein
MLGKFKLAMFIEYEYVRLTMYCLCPGRMSLGGHLRKASAWYHDSLLDQAGTPISCLLWLLFSKQSSAWRLRSPIMVFQSDHRNLEAFIFCEGQLLTDYRDANRDHQSGNPIRYIRAISSASFQICVRVPRSLWTAAISVRPYVDGKPINGQIINGEIGIEKVLIWSGRMARVNGNEGQSKVPLQPASGR